MFMNSISKQLYQLYMNQDVFPTITGIDDDVKQ